jgi:hypothetical protein
LASKCSLCLGSFSSSQRDGGRLAAMTFPNAERAEPGVSGNGSQGNDHAGELISSLDSKAQAETASASYEASQLKRDRATRAEMVERQNALYNIVLEMQPMTVRQVFYQASVRGLVEKSEQGYGKVQRALVEMRRAGMLPFDWIADNHPLAA